MSYIVCRNTMAFEINMNIKIQHEIRVRVDEELEDMFDEDSDVF